MEEEIRRVRNERETRKGEMERVGNRDEEERWREGVEERDGGR